MTKKEFEDEIVRLQNHKGNLIQAKTAIQNKLAQIKARSHDRESSAERIVLCAKFNDVEQKIQTVNRKLRDISLIKRDLPVGEKTLIGNLVKMRDKYQQFATDKSRVTSMRLMASEFVTELNPIIWRLLNE